MDDVADVVDAGPWSPKSLAGLVLWLNDKAGTITTANQTVSQWSDQSGKSNNAYEKNLNNQPVFVSKGLNGHDVVRFSPNNASLILQIDPSPTLEWGKGDFAFLMVVHYLPQMSPAQVWQKTQQGVFITIDSNVNAITPTGSAHALLQNPQSFHVVAVRGAKMEVRVDGVSTAGTQSTSDVSEKGAGVVLGWGQPYGVGGFELGELIVVNTTLADPDLLAGEQYLKQKFGL